MVTGDDGNSLVLTAAKLALASAPLSVLLVGAKEEDFFLIREILQQTGKALSAELDHAHSLERAKAMLRQKAYGLVIFEYETGDTKAVRLVADLFHAGVS